MPPKVVAECLHFAGVAAGAEVLDDRFHGAALHRVGVGDHDDPHDQRPRGPLRIDHTSSSMGWSIGAFIRPGRESVAGSLLFFYVCFLFCAGRDGSVARGAAVARPQSRRYPVAPFLSGPISSRAGHHGKINLCYVDPSCVNVAIARNTSSHRRAKGLGPDAAVQLAMVVDPCSPRARCASERATASSGGAPTTTAPDGAGSCAPARRCRRAC